MLESDRPPDYEPNLIHVVLVLAGLLGRISPAVLTPAWLALAAIACWPWARINLALTVVAMSLCFTLADWAGLALLPRMGRSFGPVTPPLLALTLIRTALTFVIGLLWAIVRPSAHGAAWPGLLLTAVLNLVISATSLYATWVEPFRIGVTRARLRSPKLNGCGALRLLHISDLHVEHITPREKKLLRLVEELAPDLIVLTGDYLTLSSVHNTDAQVKTHDLLAQLCDVVGSRRPIYAVTGSPPVDHPDVVPRIFEDLPITWLLDAVAETHINNHTVRLTGMRCTANRHLDGPRLHRLLDGSPTQAGDRTPFTLLLYHSPDLMPEAVELGVDLYLCGHTHGGQIRLPFFGAVFTSSDFRKQYEMGHYEEDDTTLYVSRGLGLEGLGAPRARFLAPPEIVLWTLSA